MMEVERVDKTEEDRFKASVRREDIPSNAGLISIVDEEEGGYTIETHVIAGRDGVVVRYGFRHGSARRYSGYKVRGRFCYLS